MFDLFLPLVGEVPKGMGAGGGWGEVEAGDRNCE
jgi:hypothetical protein